MITYNRKTQTAQQWSEETGIKAATILKRLRSGWSIERALTEKPFAGKNQSYKLGGGEISGDFREGQS